MTIGQGRYDNLCTYVREHAGISLEGPSPGGAIVIVIGGNLGSGFSCQADLVTMLTLPGLLEYMAGQIRRDLPR